jgi:hypothetical protein
MLNLPIRNWCPRVCRTIDILYAPKDRVLSTCSLQSLQRLLTHSCFLLILNLEPPYEQTMDEPNPLPSKRSRNTLRLCLMTKKKKKKRKKKKKKKKKNQSCCTVLGPYLHLWCNMGLDRSADHASVPNLSGQLKRCLKLDCEFVIW